MRGTVPLVLSSHKMHKVNGTTSSLFFYLRLGVVGGQATSVAERVAVERCEPAPGRNGSLVGYQVRLDTAW